MSSGCLKCDEKFRKVYRARWRGGKKGGNQRVGAKKSSVNEQRVGGTVGKRVDNGSGGSFFWLSNAVGGWGSS